MFGDFDVRCAGCSISVRLDGVCEFVVHVWCVCCKM